MIMNRFLRAYGNAFFIVVGEKPEESINIKIMREYLRMR